MSTPEGLVPGPVVDDIQTYFGERGDVPADWEVRMWTDTPWRPVGNYNDKARVMQCRPVPEPEPRTEPRWGKVPAIEAYDRGLTAKCDWDDDGVLVEALARRADGDMMVLDGNLNRIAYADADGMVEVLIEDDDR